MIMDQNHYDSPWNVVQFMHHVFANVEVTKQQNKSYKTYETWVVIHVKCEVQCVSCGMGPE